MTAAERHIGEICTASGVGLTILRPTLIYSAGAYKTVTAAARLILLFGFYPLHGTAQGKHQPVDVDDLVAAALAALDSTAAGRDFGCVLQGGQDIAVVDLFGA